MRPAPKLTVYVVVLLFAAAGCIRRSPRKQDMVLATVGEKEVKESDFRAELDRLEPTMRSKYRRERRALLDKMIEEEVFYQSALDSNLAETPEAKKRLTRAAEDAAIERFKQLEIYSGVAVTREEIEKRYSVELARREESSLVKSVFYVCTLQEDRVRNLVNAVERGVKEGLPFREIARRNSFACQSFELDSAGFSDLPGQMRNIAVGLNNRTGTNLRGTPLYFFKDAEVLDAKLLSPCARRIRRAIREEKKERALGKWLSSRRASSTIRVYEKAMDEIEKSDAVAAEVNGVSLTVGDVAAPLEGLSVRDREKKAADSKALLDEAIDREILRQEALKENLSEDKVVKEKVARESRRILVELVVERDVAGVTPTAREKSRAELATALRKAAGVKILAENLKKMYVPASKEIEEIFGGGTI